MTYKAQSDEKGIIIRYIDTQTGESISAKEHDRRMQMNTMMAPSPSHSMMQPQLQAMPMGGGMPMQQMQGGMPMQMQGGMPGSAYATPTDGFNGNMAGPPMLQQGMGMQQQGMPQHMGMQQQGMGMQPGAQNMPMQPGGGLNPLIQPGAQMLAPSQSGTPGLPQAPSGAMGQSPGGMPMQTTLDPSQGLPPTAGMAKQGKSLRLEGVPHAHPQAHATMPGGMPGAPGMTSSAAHPRKPHGFLDATSIAILLPTLVLLALIIAAAHKKRLFPWQTIRTFNPPSGMMTPRDYERSFLCPPNLRRHGRLGKRNPEATWSAEDGVVVPFGFLARTHLPITIPMGRLPNKNMFMVAPSGSGKTTLMRAIIKSLLAKPCVIVALEAKANDPNLDEKKEGFKYALLPEAQAAGFDCLYFNPLDVDSVHWNPLDLAPITFASSIVQDVNSLDAEEQHWAERDMGYIEGLAQLLKWGAVQVIGEDENGQASELEQLPCNPRGLMKLVNNRRNIVESLRQSKNKPEVNPADLSELTQRLSSIIRTDADWDKNIQGVRGRLRMFKNPDIMRVTEKSNIDMHKAMHKPTVLIFGAPASLGPDAESLAGTFVYQLQQALHTRYGTVSVLPLFAFFDEYQTLNIDLAGRLSAIVRGANGGLTVILQNIAQIATGSSSKAEAELRTIFSNAAIRVCLHNADEQTAAFFSEEIGKHAIIVPGIADHYQSTGFGIFPSSWNRIHSQQVVARVDSDTIKRMEKHHALVYLAPAGDPEFGETKPFMVDLRGIEEIAKLHLLHNVTVRPDPSEDAIGPQIGQPPRAQAPSFMQVQNPADAINNAFNGQSNQPSQENQQAAQTPLSAQTVGQLAQSVGQAAQNLFGQFMGKVPNKPEYEVHEATQTGPASFAAVPQVAADLAVAGELMRHTGGAFGAGPAPMVYGETPAAAPGFAQSPVSAEYEQLSSLQAASRIAAQSMDGLDPMAQPAAAPVQAAAPAPSGGERVCPLCSKFAGKGKFCIECGQFIGAATPAAAPVAAVEAAIPAPSGHPVQSAPGFASGNGFEVPTVSPMNNPMPAPEAQQVVGPLGSRQKDPNKPQPRYGGLAVTNRDSMPSKRAAMAESAQQMMGSNPWSASAATAVDPRLAYGTGGNPDAGPLSQRVAVESEMQGQDNPYHRSPVKSLTPDVSKFNLNQQGQQSQPGVEF